MSTDPEAIGEICVFCEQQIQPGENATMMLVVTDSEARRQAGHPECQALGIIGHTFGVCSCTGYGHDRAAALELRRRLIEERNK